MTIDSTDNDKGNSFEYRLKEVSDEEIVSILRNREHYQPQAVKAAIREAIKRGIIESIEDLEKDEYKPQSIPKSIFPISMVKSQNEAIFKSLCRICYFFGGIPFIMGFFQIANHHLMIGIFAVVFGISMVYLTIKLEKERKPFLSQFMLFLNVPAIGFAIYRLTSFGSLLIMDIFIIAVTIIVLFYTTLYIYKLILYFNRNL
jgi:hypothetical protein